MEDKNQILPVESSTINNTDPNNREMSLDDARRVKVLSPGMLVAKRFIRNRLAVIGLVIIIAMFLFAFIGPIFSPYEQTQVFKGIGAATKDYAGAIYNTELRYTVKPGESFAGPEIAKFLLAVGKNQSTFSTNDRTFAFFEEGEGHYRISELDQVAEELITLQATGDVKLTKIFEDAYQAAKLANQTTFEVEGVTYVMSKKAKATLISSQRDIALGTLFVYDAYDPSQVAIVNSYDFKLASARAIANDENSFKVGMEEFASVEEDGLTTIYNSSGESFAEISRIIVNPLNQSEVLSIGFKKAVREAITNQAGGFSFGLPDEGPVDYDVVRVNTNYYIKKEMPTELIRILESPSAEHPLGLDNNGMDVMTRLMYGGRVSLLVGFVVVFFEILIGVIIGGISGYFGGWVDTALMRFVDLFNSIPFYPMVIIFGSVMDTLEVSPMTRIFLLMLVLGLLGWTGIARVVRGQILSLREQDFMVATEATGIRTSRQIFRHLVPNVMPLLIVSATANLGGVIISEATLGFLGLGIRYPLASWGSIINVASDAFIMTNYWFMWIPAGMLILLTVLGFNFIGDGLRDAYDPKMKR